MTGIRLHAVSNRIAAEQLYTELEHAFEDSGYAISINELTAESDSGWEVSVYLENDDTSVREKLKTFASDISNDIQIAEEILPDIDWVSHSLEGLDRVRAGRILLHGSHDKPANCSSDIEIEIDAGQAFGTGHHGTTWGCLTMIQESLKRTRPASALDIGTGSAVLAIAIAKLARIPVIATDNDPVAVRVARENIVRNRAPGITTLVASGFRNRQISLHGRYDLIVANILAKPLMKLAPDIGRHLSERGDIILSGILARQRRAVIAAYVASGFRHFRTIEKEGWVTLWLKR